MLEHIDYYKFTMGQMLYEHHPDLTVTYTFKDRTGNLICPDGLQATLDAIRERGFAPEELDYLAHISGFTTEYLDYLRTQRMPRVHVENNRIQTWGPAPLASLWETIILAKYNDLHNAQMRKYLGLKESVPTGTRKWLQKKIEILSDNPKIRVIEFGTRRRYSLEWQREVIQTMMEKCPSNLVGTSNVGFAAEFDLPPVGSFAHEMPMIWAAVADLDKQSIRDSHRKFLWEWHKMWGPQIALTDTFGTDFFFKDFTEADLFSGLRHDSGDPFLFAQRALRFYNGQGIDPMEKVLLFSDSLNIDLIQRLHKTVSPHIPVAFGWGTNLTNDTGFPATNIVMKATGVSRGLDYRGTVKLSDDAGKHTGTAHDVRRYKEIFAVNS